MEIRRSLWRVQNSGLENLMKRYTFDNWQEINGWQTELLNKAKAYAESPDGWFVVCGKSGTGKTHICTAVCGKLMFSGWDVRYMLWRDEGTKIKAAVKDQEEYRRLLDPLKTVKVLYIDDLFKTGKGADPTTADVNLAFEILNYRYNNAGLLTVISSEMPIEDILEVDEAVGSRIYERCRKGAGVYFDMTGKQNWRMRELGTAGSK